MRLESLFTPPLPIKHLKEPLLQTHPQHIASVRNMVAMGRAMEEKRRDLKRPRIRCRLRQKIVRNILVC